MEMTADSTICVDTNILLYLYNDNMEIKQKVLQKINSLVKANNRLCVTEQIVREFLVVQTNIQKINSRVDINKLVRDFGYLTDNFTVIYPSGQSVQLLLEYVNKHGLQGKKIHDANIAAVVRANNISKILTNNPSDFLFCLTEGFEIITL